MRFNREQFFDGVRKFEGALTQQQVNGLNFILDSMEKDPFLTNIEHAAYMFATVKHETGHTYQPIHEYGSHKYFVRRYGSHTKVGRRLGNDTPEEGATYAGRGDVQLTGEDNYEKAEEALRKYYPDIVKEFEQRTGKRFDLTVGDQPNDEQDAENASDPTIAYAIMSHGMRTGMFTTRKLSDYDSAKGFDARNARKIINGLDQADMIVRYYKKFLPILRQSLISNSAVKSTSPADKPADSPPTDNTAITSTPPTNTVAIEGVKPYRDIGLGGVLKNDAKTILPANIGLNTVSEWIQQSTGWPQWIVDLLPKLVVVLIICTVLWLLYRVVTYVMHNFRENERVKLLAQINADPKLKDIVLK